MSHDEIRDRMDAFLDDELEDDARRRLEAHLESCRTCADELAWLRDLRRRTATLPREREPERDLWPGIEARLGGRVVPGDFGEAPRRSGGGWRRWGLLAAAAMLLMALSSGLTAWWMAVEEPADPGPAGVALAEMSSVERDYQRLTDELLAALDERRDRLDPETVRVVEENLEIINDAIDEMRAALRRDPANAGLASQLTTAYRKRIELLQKANAITT